MSQRNFKLKKQTCNTINKLLNTKKIKPQTNIQHFRKSFVSSVTPSLTSSLTKTTDMSEIDDLIIKRNEHKKLYSKSLVNSPYTPLSKTYKIKELAEISNTTCERFKKYSNIFEQIKQEINDISQMRLTNATHYKKEVNSDYIEEKDEEYLITPINPSKKKVSFKNNITNTINVNDFNIETPPYETIETDVDAEENKLPIVITETKDYESLVELKKKCRKRKTSKFNYKYNDNMVIFYKEPLTARNKKKCNLCLNENNNYNQKNSKHKTNIESNSNIRYYEGEDGCASCGCSLQ
jgi:hypothetical protein